MIKKVGSVLIALLLVALYVNYIKPIPEKRQEIREEIFIREKKLKKYRALTKQKDEIAGELMKLKLRLDRVKQELLPVKNETLGLVTVQQIVREIAGKTDIRIVALRPIDILRGNHLIGLPVQVTAIGDMKAVTEFLKGVVDSPYLLSLDSMNIRVINIQKPDKIRLKFTITGYIERPEKSLIKEEKPKGNA